MFRCGARNQGRMHVRRLHIKTRILLGGVSVRAPVAYGCAASQLLCANYLIHIASCLLYSYTATATQITFQATINLSSHPDPTVHFPRDPPLQISSLSCALCDMKKDLSGCICCRRRKKKSEVSYVSWSTLTSNLPLGDSQCRNEGSGYDCLNCGLIGIECLRGFGSPIPPRFKVNLA